MTASTTYLSDETLKIALAAFLHDIGKFAQRARGRIGESGEPAFYPSQQFLDDNRERLQPFNSRTKRYSHEHAIYTAAFFDHLEKVLPKCFYKDNWAGREWVGDLAAGHHFVRRENEQSFVKDWNSFERWLIAVADRLASALDREGFCNFDEGYNRNEEIANYRSARLWPVMEKIKTSRAADTQHNDGSFNYRVPLKALQEDMFFPAEKSVVVAADNCAGADEYRKLFYGFVEELRGLEQFTGNVELWFEQFENLYMRYAGQIPAATVSPAMQDISLYDHSKITAAIAVALYQYHTENQKTEITDVEDGEAEKLLFIGAGFFGIQKFIFASGGSTNKAAAKILRGRSFYVSLLSELIADMILRETGLPVTSVIFNAAGQATILAPNLPRVINAVKKVKQQVNDWLINGFYGQTSLGVACVPVSQHAIVHEYRKVWHKLGRAMEQQKYQKFDISRLGGVQKQFFEKIDVNLGICPFCGQRPAVATFDDEGEKTAICGICHDQLDMGKRLVKAEAIAVWKHTSEGFGRILHEPVFGVYQVWLGSIGEAIKQAGKGNLISMARITPASEEQEWCRIAFKPLKGYVPVYTAEDEQDEFLNTIESVEAGAIKSFEIIANSAVKDGGPGVGRVGVAALGVLKADVDNLGMIFGLGLREEIQTITRVSILSRQFNNFFAIYLPHLLRNEYPNIYTVFSGGDDLFLIGPWCDIVSLAPVIKKKFAKFVCQNDDITISMGISIHKPGEPVRAIAQAAEEALERSKANPGKDSITIFGETVKFAQLAELEEPGDMIKTWLSNGMLNTAMLYRFNTAIEEVKLANMAVNKATKMTLSELASALSWKARLKYSLVRSSSEKALKAGDEVLRRAELENMIGWIEKHKDSMRIPLWRAIYSRRKR
ncbi:MAG TPA: type III-A CRISPR-associated protein Cas10/Csm1 [Candidatus Rifleibacterium sp.]|nr:type III-A CRISPR-associated protein Cas10/Csm1 [Candidatus Rifleibacterium sp.]HPT46760.1 type III-A CRISPR-associated protein Cas10/Csm1 [Candidatus Rifleibacterium sp.]